MPNFDPHKHRVQWNDLRLEFSIRCIRSTSTNRGYHQSWYEVITRTPMDEEDWKRLDACGLLGMGQAYGLVREGPDTVTDVVPPVVVDAYGALCPDVEPRSWNGAEPFTKTIEYTYHRYVVRRICDSGD